MICSYFRKPETVFGIQNGIGCNYRLLGRHYPNKDKYICLNFRITGMNCLHESELSCGITPVIEVVKDPIVIEGEFRRLELQK